MAKKRTDRIKVRDFSDAVSTRDMRRKKNNRLRNGINYAFEAAVRSNGTSTLLTRSGRHVDLRTVPGRIFTGLIADLVEQLGGPDNVTAAELQLIRRAAALSVDLSFQEAEALARQGPNKGRLDPTVYHTMADSQRRVLQALGLRRRARDVTPIMNRTIDLEATVVDDDDDDDDD